jgi:hypothetical protein
VRYAEVLARIYRAVASVAGAGVVVDTSKRAGDAALVRLVPGPQVRYVHLVRDPRAVAESWRTRDPVHHGPARTARDWVAFNLLFEAVRARHGPGRSIRARYEDFCGRPAATLQRVAGLTGLEGRPLPLVKEHVVRIPETHTVLGNPSRFDIGDVELRDREEWRDSLPASSRRVVTAIGGPMLLRYGYAVGVGAPASPA